MPGALDIQERRKQNAETVRGAWGKEPANRVYYDGAPRRFHQRPRRLARPRTSPFHGGNAGSNPAGDANLFIELQA